MSRLSFVMCLLFFPLVCFAQSSEAFNVVGAIPPLESDRLYQIQIGSFRNPGYAQAAFSTLHSASLNPVYENYLDYTRVMISGLDAAGVASCLDTLRSLGFREVWIKEDASVRPPVNLPVSEAALPASVSTEIAFKTVRVGETVNVAGLAADRNISQWTSSTPSSFTVNSSGDVKGISIGNGFININESEYISIAVVPAQEFYIVPEAESALLPPGSKTGIGSSESVTDYRTEPTFRLAYRFNNRNENRGASGRNGGVDILARGENYEWLWTSYGQGGWFYDLNGVKHEMVDGYQKDESSFVSLTLKPEFIYDNGVPYLQLRHILYNPNNFAVSGQKFGASADVMIHRNDSAALVHKPYGAYMTDSESNPSIELMFVGLQGEGITPLDTLWLGTWGGGAHLNYIYADERADVFGHDTAIGFSYQNIDLAAGQTKEFIVRFTLARTEH